MDLKKKLGVGVLTGALGLSLIGGGTWAAFNDVEETTNSFAAGTLDLGIEGGSFDVTNMKPGDTIDRTVTVSNNGSLNINQVLVDISSSGWEDEDVLDMGITNTEGDFLSQFEATLSWNGHELASGTLEELVNLSHYETPEIPEILHAGSSYNLDVHIEFVEDDTLVDGSRLHEQNKYQGEGVTLTFDFEATQEPGEAR